MAGQDYWGGWLSAPVSHQKETELILPAVKVVFETGKTDLKFVSQVKKAFEENSVDKRNYYLEAIEELRQRRKNSNYDEADSLIKLLDIKIVIHSEYSVLESRFLGDEIGEEEFVIYLEDFTFGTTTEYSKSKALFIRCKETGLNRMEALLRQDPELKKALDELVANPYLSVTSPDWNDILYELRHNEGRFKGIYTSLDLVTKTVDYLVWLSNGTIPHFQSLIGSLLLNLIARPFKNMLTIPEWKWDPEYGKNNPSKPESPLEKEFANKRSKKVRGFIKPFSWDDLVWYKQPVYKGEPFQPFFLFDFPYEKAEAIWLKEDVSSGNFAKNQETKVFEAQVRAGLQRLFGDMSRTFDKETVWKHLNETIPNIKPLLKLFFGEDEKAEKFFEEMAGVVAQALIRVHEKGILEMVRIGSENMQFLMSAEGKFLTLNAFMCGLWNSVVDAIFGGIEMLGGFLYFLGESKKFLANIGPYQRMAVEYSEDLMNMLFPPEGQTGVNWDSLVTNALAACETTANALKAVFGYLSDQVSPVRVAYMMGAVIEFIVETVVSILLTAGISALANFLKGAKGLGLVLLNVMELYLAVDKFQDFVGEVVLNWVFKAFRWIISLFRRNGDNLVREGAELSTQLAEVALEKLAPEVQERARKEVGIDIKQLEREGATFLHLSEEEFKITLPVCNF